MALSKIQPQPWRWCMQVPVMRCRWLGLSPLFTGIPQRVTLMTHYPPLSYHLH